MDTKQGPWDTRSHLFNAALQRRQALSRTLTPIVLMAVLGTGCSDAGTKSNDTSGVGTPSPGSTQPEASPTPGRSASPAAAIVSLPKGFTLRHLPPERQPFLDGFINQIYSNPGAKKEIVSIGAQRVYFRGRELGVVVVSELAPGARVNREKMMRQFSNTAGIEPQREKVEGEVVHYFEAQVHYYMVVNPHENMTAVIAGSRKDARVITRAVIRGRK